MKNEIINRLTNDHKGWASVDSKNIFLLKWSGLFIVFFFGNLAWMPWRESVGSDFGRLMFNLENLAWAGLTLSSAIALYESIFPERGLSSAGKIALTLIGVIFLETIFFREAVPVDHWIAETTIIKGRCGIIISLFAILQTPLFVAWAKRGAPRNAGLTGVFAALSSSSMAALLMQIVCVEDNSFHVMFWHFLPLSLSCYGAHIIASKLLRW